MELVKHRNGIRYPFLLKDEAKKLRESGFTHREIAKKINVNSQTTIYLWTKGINLTKEQQKVARDRGTPQTFSLERREKLRIAARVNLAPYRKKYNKKELLDKIISFYKEHKRIPLKREFNMYHEYQIRFGSWNNAIRAAGFQPNPVIFSYKFIGKDGHSCDSFTEKIIDDWLYDCNIEHMRKFKYANTKMTADFFIKPNIMVEFFGLAGVQKKYDAIIIRKKELAKKLNFQLIEIYPDDIFKKNRLGELFSFHERPSALRAGNNALAVGER